MSWMIWLIDIHRSLNNFWNPEVMLISKPGRWLVSARTCSMSSWILSVLVVLRQSNSCWLSVLKQLVPHSSTGLLDTFKNKVWFEDSLTKSMSAVILILLLLVYFRILSVITLASAWHIQLLSVGKSNTTIPLRALNTLWLLVIWDKGNNLPKLGEKIDWKSLLKVKCSILVVIVNNWRIIIWLLFSTHPFSSST